MGPKMGLPPPWTSLISATAYSRPQPTFKVQLFEKSSFFPNHSDANGENYPQRILIISQQKRYRPMYIISATAKSGPVGGTHSSWMYKVQ